MPLNYKAGSAADFEPVAAGSHIAICDIVADIGLQPGSGLYPKPKRQVVIRWNIPAEQIEYEKDGKKMSGPAVIAKRYTASMNEKANLRHDLESWRGKQFTDEQAEAFDVSAILGKPCMINVIHRDKDGKTYANISGVGAIPKGMDSKTLISSIPPVFYGPDDTSKYLALPDWIKKLIDGQIIMAGSKTTDPDAEPEMQGNQTDDGSYITDEDIPF